MKKAAITALIGIVVIAAAYANNPTTIPEADPDTVILKLADRTFIGTDHGTICIETYYEISPVMGMPEPNVPGFTVIGESATGEPGEVIATRILRMQ